MWIDTNNDAVDTTTLNMSPTGLNELRDYGATLQGQWSWNI